MPTLRELKAKVLADRGFDGPALAVLAELLYADGRIDRAEADFLVELHRRVERVCDPFERFFYAAVRAHVLADGAITPDAAAWLRRLVFADGQVDPREHALLRGLRAAARTCPEFDDLCTDCLSHDGGPNPEEASP